MEIYLEYITSLEKILHNIQQYSVVLQSYLL